MSKGNVLQALKVQIAYRWKVQAARSWGCECVAYIDARQVMDLLDEVVGPENWQDRYYDVGKNVYCELAIRIGDEWVRKSDCGTESQFEGEKGQASDAFKRAAVKWGIGRFLYALDPIKVKSIQTGTDHQGKPKYSPADEHGRRIYNLTAYINSLAGQADSPATPKQKEVIKDLCQKLDWSGEVFKAYLKKLDTSWSKLTHGQAARVLNELEDLAGGAA